MGNYNLDVTYQKACKDFAAREPKEMAELSGCIFYEEAGTISVKYLGENYIVKYPEGKVVKEEGEDVNLSVQILILHYLTNAKGQAVGSQLISFKELPDGFIYIDPFTKRVINPMLKLFSHNLEEFLALADKLGGKKNSMGDISVTIEALPRVPITYVIWQADEEFPASGNVLFDSSASGYLPTEDFALLSSLVIWKMKELSQK